MFIADTGNERIRYVDAAAQTITTSVGSGGGGTFTARRRNRFYRRSITNFPRTSRWPLTAVCILPTWTISASARLPRAALPAITSGATASGTRNQFFQYRITASGHPAPVFSASGLPPGLLLVDGLISGFPSISGAFDVELLAFNQVGSATKQLRITLLGTGANNPPVFSDSPPVITVSPDPVATGTAVTFVAPTATDTDGDNLAYDCRNFGDGQHTAPAQRLRMSIRKWA